VSEKLTIISAAAPTPLNRTGAPVPAARPLHQESGLAAGWYLMLGSTSLTPFDVLSRYSSSSRFRRGVAVI